MILLVIIGAVLVGVLGTILNGFVLTFLWQWFIEPFGLAPIGIAWAIGLCMTIRMVTINTETVTKDRTLPDALTNMIVTPLIMLLIGFIVHLYM